MIIKVLKSIVKSTPFGENIYRSFLLPYRWISAYVMLPIICFFSKNEDKDALSKTPLPASNVLVDAPYCEEFSNVFYCPDYRAVYDPSGNLIPTSLLVRGPNGSRQAFDSPSHLDLDSLPQKGLKIQNAMYGGYIFSHYGHFLTESLARLWPLLSKERAMDEPISYPSKILFSQGYKGPLSEANSSLLKALENNFNCKVLIVDSPIQVQRLYLSELSMVHNWKLHKQFAQFTNKLGEAVLALSHSNPTKKFGLKVYLSRRMLDPILRNILNERKLEEALFKKGFDIVYPEKMTIAEQINVFNAADVIVGAIGSAFHTLLLAEVYGKKIIYLTTNNAQVNKNFINIDSAVGVHAHYLPVLHPFNFSIKRSTMNDVYCDLRSTMTAINEILRL